MWDIESDSVWSPFDGAAMNGPVKGTVIPRVPTLQTTWKEWLALNPDTDVVVWEPWPTHSDARHGHGAIKWVGSAGLEQMFIDTIQCGELDTRLAENALIMGIQVKGTARAYPLAEVRKGNNVIHDEMQGDGITVWAEPDSHTMGAYQRNLDGQTLTFERSGGTFKDVETGSSWNILGIATDGPLQGKRLTHADWHFMEWHTWASYHRPSEIYENPEANRLAPEPADLARLVEDLGAAGYSVEPEGEYLYARLPLCAQRGLTAAVNGKRLSFFVFQNTNDASDYGGLRSHAAQAGIAAVESDPTDEDIFTDATYAQRKPEAEIPHSELIADSAFLAVVEQAIGGGGGDPDGEKSYQEIFAGLTEAGYQASAGGDSSEELVRDNDFMAGYILPAKAVNGAWARIKGDRFMVIRFIDAAAAEEFAGARAHRIAAGNVVFRSDPDGQYKIPFPVATIEMPDDQVEWSTLPEDPAFLEAAKGVVGG
jgi:hypothetical protein